MPENAALRLALRLQRTPQLVSEVRTTVLPVGVTHLLEVVSGERESIERAREISGQTDAAVRRAAEFFVEQVLLHGEADAYRVLGCRQDADDKTIRRHMALLLRWLHPDSALSSPDTFAGYDRDILVHRVTQAWENLKNSERRSRYDATLERQPVSSRKNNGVSRPAPNGAGSNRHAASTVKPRKPPAAGPHPRHGKQLVVIPLGRESVLTRLARYLRLR